MKITKKKVVIGAVAVVCIGAIIAVRSGGEPKGFSVTTAEIVERDVRATLDLKAPLEGTESVEVVSRLHNEILNIDVKEGDKVKKGQVIATLATANLEDEIEKLEDNIELLQIQYNEGKSKKGTAATRAQESLDETLEASQRAYEVALENLRSDETSYSNAKVLFNSGMESQAGLDEKEAAYKASKREVEKYNVVDGNVVATQAQLMELKDAESSLSDQSGSKSIEIAKKDLERKKKELDDCLIKSTIDGTITRVNAKVGRFADEIDEKMPMFVIENIEKLKMRVDVSEYDIDRVEVEQKVEISSSALGSMVVDGKVARISPTGEQKDGSNERIIPIEIEIIGDTKELIAGINASAKIITEVATNALAVPFECLLSNGDDTYSVFILQEGNTLKKITVETGVEEVTETQIISEELKAGDKLVLNPTPDMTDGMSVIVSE